MSATCRRHVGDIAKCRQILADIACRCDTEEAPTYPIYVNYSRQVQVSPNIRVSYPTIEFLCLNSNKNQEIADMSGIPRNCCQMSCRLDTLADTTFSCVCDVTSDVSRHVARHDTECRHLGTKTTRRHPTYGAKVSGNTSILPLLPPSR